MKHMRLREIAEEGKDKTNRLPNETLNGSPDF